MSVSWLHNGLTRVLSLSCPSGAPVWPVSGVAEAMLSTYFTPWSVEIYLPGQARAGMTAEVYIRRWLATYLWGEWRLSQKVNLSKSGLIDKTGVSRHRVGFLQPYTWYQLRYRLVNSSTSESTPFSCTLTVNTLANGKIVRRTAYFTKFKACQNLSKSL